MQRGPKKNLQSFSQLLLCQVMIETTLLSYDLVSNMLCYLKKCENSYVPRLIFGD